LDKGSNFGAGSGEKGVNVIADLTAPPEALGDRYGVETRIVTWEKPDVLKIRGSGTFARVKAEAFFEVLSGISVGELMILFPPNQLREGVAVRTQ
jgi:hypothetical protein